MNNNSVAIIIAGILGFVGIIIVGKWLLDEHDHNHQEIQQQSIPSQPQTQAQTQEPMTPQPIVVQPVFSQYHNRNDFWQGYSDAWNRLGMRQDSPGYIQGYQIGLRDRRSNRPYYHDHYCPPGFSMRVPGFSLRIK